MLSNDANSQIRNKAGSNDQKNTVKLELLKFLTLAGIYRNPGTSWRGGDKQGPVVHGIRYSGLCGLYTFAFAPIKSFPIYLCRFLMESSGSISHSNCYIV